MKLDEIRRLMLAQAREHDGFRCSRTPCECPGIWQPVVTLRAPEQFEPCDPAILYLAVTVCDSHARMPEDDRKSFLAGVVREATKMLVGKGFVPPDPARCELRYESTDDLPN